MIRVVLVTKTLGRGGVERLLVDQAARAPAGIDYLVVCVDPSGAELTGELSSLGVEVKVLPAGLARWPLALVHLLSAERSRCDAIHVVSPLPAAVVRSWLRMLPMRSRPAMVYTEHSLWATYRPATRWANRLTYRWDDHRFLVSGEIERRLPRRHRGSGEVLLHGVPTEDVARASAQRDRARRRSGISAEGLLVVAVGNLRPEKGHRVLLQAVPEVLRRVVDPVTVLLVGDGPERERLETLHGGLGLGSTVRFLGSRPDARELIAAADVVCLPSLHEGLPVTLMEALVLGRPIVASRVGGVPEAVTDGVEGRLVRPGDPVPLAEALIEVLSDASLRTSMGGAARKRGAAFDGATAISRIEEVYRELATSG